MYFSFFKYEVNIMPRGMCGKNPINIIPMLKRRKVGFSRNVTFNWLGVTCVISRRD